MMDETEDVQGRLRKVELRLERVDALLQALEQQIKSLTTQVGELVARVAELATRLSALTVRVDGVDNGAKDFRQLALARLDASDANVKELRQQLQTDVRWLLGLQIASTVGLAGMMAKGFGWL